VPNPTFPEFTNLERNLSVAVRFVGQPNPFRELLARVVYADAQHLDYLAQASSGDVVRALFLALAWGGNGIPPISPSPTMESVERAIDIESGRATAKADLPEEVGSSLADAYRIDFALPLVAVDADEFMHVAAPRQWTAPGLFEQLTDGGLYRVLIFEEECALEMARREQVSARQRMKPEAVVAADQLWRRQRQPDTLKLGDDARWNEGTTSVCTAWLAIAVAYRQLGSINLPALRIALFILNYVDRGVAVALSRAMTAGLPGWSPLLDSSVADAYEQQTALWEQLHHRSDDAAELDDPSDTTEYALALLHTGRHQDALDVTKRLVKQTAYAPDATLTDQLRELKSTHAYALARNGRVDEALALIAPEIAKLNHLNLYDQCEFLHLLGDLMEKQGKPAAAVTYFLQERALRSPALHRRLHNRQHLLRVLIHTQRDPDLIVEIALEGLRFADTAQAATEVETFATTLVDYADLLSEEARSKTLASLPGESALADGTAVGMARTAFGTTIAEPLTDSQRAVLQGHLASAGAFKAFACVRLALLPNTLVPERVRLLSLDPPLRISDSVRR
jgi:tetratricopeptide (TPR) repeat protein